MGSIVAMEDGRFRRPVHAVQQRPETGVESELPAEAEQPLPSAIERSWQRSKKSKVRLVVELSDSVNSDLTWLAAIDGENKTTVVNRAIKVLAAITEAQTEGKLLAIVDPETGNGETFRII